MIVNKINSMTHAKNTLDILWWNGTSEKPSIFYVLNTLHLNSIALQVILWVDIAKEITFEYYKYYYWLRNNKKEGIERYYDNKFLIREYMYHNNIKHGKYHQFATEGFNQQTGIFLSGKEHGTFITSYSSGKLIAKRLYNHGDLIKYSEYDVNGKEIVIKNDGILTEYKVL